MNDTLIGMSMELRVDDVRRVWADDNHNAFTDLCRFGGAFFLTFRSCPEGHPISPAAFVRVLRSTDAEAWDEVFSFSVPRRDTRDPHFLVYDGRLFVYSGTWPARPNPGRKDLNGHLGFCAVSSDGFDWEGPLPMETTRGYYIWRAATHGGKAYLCGRRKRDFATLPTVEEEYPIQESVLLESTNGFDWRPAGLFQQEYGNETAFVFRSDGEVIALARNRVGPALLCRSAPPYSEWRRTRLSHNLGGPMLAWWDGRLVAGGRKTTAEAGPVTQLYWIEQDELVEAATLPSAGDNSYPGFAALSADRALVSYYSSHEGSGEPLYPAAIYLATIGR